jgi:hypothetical protein
MIDAEEDASQRSCNCGLGPQSSSEARDIGFGAASAQDPLSHQAVRQGHGTHAALGGNMRNKSIGVHAVQELSNVSELRSVAGGVDSFLKGAIVAGAERATPNVATVATGGLGLVDKTLDTWHQCTMHISGC